MIFVAYKLTSDIMDSLCGCENLIYPFVSFNIEFLIQLSFFYHLEDES